MSLWERARTLNWSSPAFHRSKETHAPHGHCLHRTWVTADLSGHQPAFLPAKLPCHKHTANTQIIWAGNPAERKGPESKNKRRGEPGEWQSEETGMKLPGAKETDLTEQVLVHEKENPTLRKPPNPWGTGRKKKMKESVRDTGGSGSTFFVISHYMFRFCHPPRSEKCDLSRKKHHFSLFCVWHVRSWAVVHPLQSSFDVVNKRGAVWMPAW